MNNCSVSDKAPFSISPFVILIIIVYFATNILPSISIHNIQLVACALLVIVFFFFHLNRCSDILRSSRYVSLFLFLLFYFVSTSIPRGVQTSFNLTVVQINALLPIFLYDFVKDADRKSKIILCIACCFIYILAFIDLHTFSSYQYSNFAYVNSEDLELKNDFALSYSLIFFCTYFSYLFFNSKSIFEKPLIRYLLLGMLLICVYLSFINAYATAIFMVVLGILLSFNYNKPHFAIRSVITISVLMLSFVSFYSILKNLLVSARADRLLFRIEEVFTLMQSGDMGNTSDMLSRSDRFILSCQTFLHNPLFGVGYKCSSFDNFLYYGVGNHAEWVDNLALHGLFSFLLVVFLFKTAKINCSESPLLPMYLTFGIVGFFNPIVYCPVIIAVFFLIPLFNDIISNT